MFCAVVPLTLVTPAASTPAPSRELTRSAGIAPAPASVPNNGCPAKPKYQHTGYGQNVLCGHAPKKTFVAQGGDVIWALGRNDTIRAQNQQPNQIYGVASDMAQVDPSDCPVHGIRAANIIPPCSPSRAEANSSDSAYSHTGKPDSPPQIIPASPVDGPFSCSPNPPNPGISGDGWIGWSWEQTGPCYYLIPPDVHCTETDGQYIVNAQAPQMAAVNANTGVVDWQFVAWSMVIYREDTATQPATWNVIEQTPYYWSKPTDLFDVPLSAVAPNNWRLFSAAKDSSPAFSTQAGTFQMPSPGTYTFNFSYEWYGAPSPAAGLKPLRHASYLEFVSGYHLNARYGATVVPVYPDLSNLSYDPAACAFS